MTQKNSTVLQPDPTASDIQPVTNPQKNKSERDAMGSTVRPQGDILRESPAYHVMVVEQEGSGVQSPFLGNKKSLVKYALTDELIQAMINVNTETKMKIKRENKMKS